MITSVFWCFLIRNGGFGLPGVPGVGFCPSSSPSVLGKVMAGLTEAGYMLDPLVLLMGVSSVGAGENSL